jgi:hypothetical protein
VGWLLSPNSIGTEEAFGTPEVQQAAVQPDGIPSAEAFGTPIIAGPVRPTGIVTAEGVGRPVLSSPDSLEFSPTTADFSGGQRLRFRGGEFNMSSVQDDFSDGVVGPLWIDSSSGTGVVTEDAVLRSLVLDTGTTPGSAAHLRTKESPGYTDVQVAFRLTDKLLPLTGEVVAGELNVATWTEEIGARLRLVANRSGRTLVIQTWQPYGPASNIVVQLGTTNSAAFRILRADRWIYLFQGSELLTFFEWSASLMHIGLAARNDPTAASRARTLASSYLRRSVVQLGEYAVTDLTQVDEITATGTAPDVAADVDTVDFTAAGPQGVINTIADAFTFTRPPDLIQTRGGGGTSLTVVNDLALTRRSR